MKKAVLVLSGHTGGHLFPAVAFSQAYQKENPGTPMYLITSSRAKPLIKKLPQGIFEKVDYLNEFPFPTSVLKRFSFIGYHLPIAFVKTLFLLRKYQPGLCVGFGSYASYPGILLGRLFGIPTLIHEQNLIPGKATHELAGRADRVAVSFPETFSTLTSKRIVTGLPVREVLVREARKLQTAGKNPQKPFTILIVGGSQGAARINECVLDTFRRMSAEEKKKIAVNHITGVRDFERVRNSYRELGMVNQTFPFFEAMHELYGEADMAMTRAGACTSFELAIFGIPAVFIPYPHASGHQVANARFFESSGAAFVAEEKELTAEWLIEKIREIKDNGALRARMKQAMLKLAPWNAAYELAALAKSLIRTKDRP